MTSRVSGFVEQVYARDNQEAPRTQSVLVNRRVARDSALVETGTETDKRYGRLRQAHDRSRAH